MMDGELMVDGCATSCCEKEFSSEMVRNTQKYSELLANGILQEETEATEIFLREAGPWRWRQILVAWTRLRQGFGAGRRRGLAPKFS